MLLQIMGRPVLWLTDYLGQLIGLIFDIGESLLHGKPRWRRFFDQIVEIGFNSQPVVLITGAFVGAVLAAQGLFQLSGLQMESMGGALVSVGMLRELGPVLTGIMLSGRVGASMAAEIGTMKVTEQVDALRSMGVNPIDYLVTPRFLAMLVSVPLLITEAAALGIGAAWIVGTQTFGVSEAWWSYHTMMHTELGDIYIALIKGLVFGLLIVVISCHQGLKASHGAVGVGKGTTRAMVYSSLAILITNFFLTMFMNIFLPIGLAG